MHTQIDLYGVIIRCHEHTVWSFVVTKNEDHAKTRVCTHRNNRQTELYPSNTLTVVLASGHRRATRPRAAEGT